LPKSDFGTVVVHWAAVGALVASLLTGLRIAADALDSRLAAALSPWLPEGEVWSVHIAAGLALAAIAGAYAVYVLRSGVSARLSAGRVRAMARAGGAKQRWGVASVALHWALFALLAAQTATGVLLYLGHGGWVVAVHAGGAFGVLGYAAAHVLSHLAYGGWRHVLRIVRPAPVPSTWRRRRPLALGALAALAVAGGVAAADFAGRDALPVRRAEAPPVLDGLLDDEVWRRAVPVLVRTHQGANLAGTGASAVEVRAVHDGERIHFAFRWSDPSRSLRHLPLVKREDGWHLLHERYDIQDESAFYEDKFRRRLFPFAGLRRRRLVPPGAAAARRPAGRAERAGAALHHGRRAFWTSGTGKPRAGACSASWTTTTSGRRSTRSLGRPPAPSATPAATGRTRAPPSTPTTSATSRRAASEGRWRSGGCRGTPRRPPPRPASSTPTRAPAWRTARAGG
jgi:hypothetical protein